MPLEIVTKMAAKEAGQIAHSLKFITASFYIFQEKQKKSFKIHIQAQDEVIPARG